MELHTGRLVLRELKEADHEELNEHERDPEVARYQSREVQTLEGSLQYIRSSLKQTAEHEPRRLFDLAITLDGRVVGRAGMRIEPVQREARLWYVVRRDLWGRGYAVEAARALCELAFGTLGVHRAMVDCDPRNPASARVAEKLGMRREAHLVENVFIKGEWCDSLVYGLLDREWTTET